MTDNHLVGIEFIQRILVPMEIKMQRSEEFNKLGLYFIQDLDTICDTEDEMYKFVLGPFTDKERVRLRTYLDAITHESVSDLALRRLWNATDTDIVFSDDAVLRSMLKEARNRL